MSLNLHEKVIVRRLNRLLADEGQRLSISRSANALARYIIRDAHTGTPVAWSHSLSEWAIELGVQPSPSE